MEEKDSCNRPQNFGIKTLLFLEMLNQLPSLSQCSKMIIDIPVTNGFWKCFIYCLDSCINLGILESRVWLVTISYEICQEAYDKSTHWLRSFEVGTILSSFFSYSIFFFLSFLMSGGWTIHLLYTNIIFSKCQQVQYIRRLVCVIHATRMCCIIWHINVYVF